MVNEVPITLWGLSSRERVRRIAVRIGQFIMLDSLDALPPDASVLLLRGDFLYDERILKRLALEDQTLLQVPVHSQRVSVAAIVPAPLAAQASQILSSPASSRTLPDLQTVQLHEWSAGFQEQLRKFDPPYVLPITADNQHALEEHLYSGSYKGVTDLVTKWAWPIPAKWVVRACVTMGIVPNVVTTLSIILTIIAGVCFANGAYGSGLVAGWIMTFLDTVDGKLARVTVTSSKIGHILDHGLDIIHPPLWYIAWGMGLAAFTPPTPWLSLNTMFGIILAGYIAGRLCEGLFQLCLGQFGLFCWRPIDSFNRLITARRNPNLLLTDGLTLRWPPRHRTSRCGTTWTVVLNSDSYSFASRTQAFGVRMDFWEPRFVRGLQILEQLLIVIPSQPKHSPALRSRQPFNPPIDSVIIWKSFIIPYIQFSKI